MLLHVQQGMVPVEELKILGAHTCLVYLQSPCCYHCLPPKYQSYDLTDSGACSTLRGSMLVIGTGYAPQDMRLILPRRVLGLRGSPKYSVWVSFVLGMVGAAKNHTDILLNLRC